ncbi:hypothetical protein Tco_0127304 [Tanacetum coccineum]
MASLPPRDQIHLWLRYQVVGYIEKIVHGFEQRLKTIFGTMGKRIGDQIGLDVVGTLCFQLGGARRSMTWRQFILALGGMHLKRHAKERKSGAWLSGGHFIGRLAHHFGLAAEDAPAVDEGAQADPAPVHAPQPPPPPPAAGSSPPVFERCTRQRTGEANTSAAP